MKLNNRALMMSGGIGVAVRVLFALLGGALGFAPLLEVDASMLGVLGIVGTILCICGWIVAIGIGFAYAFFAAKEGPLTLGDAAIGGAIATGVSGLIGGLVSACLTFAAPLVVAGGSSDVIGAAIGGAIGGAVGAVCGGLILGAILGAIGGAIGGATVGKPAPSAAV